MISTHDYDAEVRRETPLALLLKDRIRQNGPIPVEAYMAECLGHPEHGYYRTRNAIGRAGDFITAPEISQVFGELIGLWCAVVWQQMGSPAPFQLVELGPGRGTMMRDALRALRIVPDVLAAARVRLVETSEALAAVQRATLAGAGAALEWTDSAAIASAGVPTIVVGNEFIDALPIRQWMDRGGERIERRVGLSPSGALKFVDAAPTHGLSETRNLAALDCLQTSTKIAALFLDYGHVKTAPSETLQAVRNHRSEHPLTSPGEADLTAHVDFEALTRHARTSGFEVDGPVAQADFLGALGIVERASRLMSANPAKAAEIEAGVARLLSPNGMGTQFKAIGLRSVDMAALPGLGGAG